MSQLVKVAIGERTLELSNLEKVLYPSVSFSKAEVIDYYSRVAEHMLVHLSGRCMTFRRWPDGVDSKSFFEKNCPGHRPAWLPTAPGPGGRAKPTSSSSETRVPPHYCRLDEPAALIWAANLAALELHAPMALASDLETPTMVVFDLDPGEPATIVQCCQVALELKSVLEAVDLRGWAKTSGSKGMQVYVPLNSPCSHREASSFALAVGQLLAKRLPKLVLVEMKRSLRDGKVFVDWPQNAFHKTTIAPYSLRGMAEPTVSTPLRWSEVAEGAGGEPLSFTAGDVLMRVTDHGDLFAETQTEVQTLPKT